MTRYRYTALKADGLTAHGEMEAANPLDLELRLQRQGAELLRVRRAWRLPWQTGLVLSRQDIINFTFMLEQLLSAGIPLLDGLKDLRATVTQRHLHDLVADLVEAIENGQTLSAALARQPDLFSPYYLSLIEAGERSGDMVAVLGRLTQALKWQDELIVQTRRLLFYPAFAGTVVLAVVLFLLLYLVPQLASFIQTTSQILPWQTRALLALGNFLRDYWYVVLVVLVMAVVMLNAWVRSSPLARLKFDQAKLNLWQFGPTLKKLLLARIASTFALLFRAGIPVLDALDVCTRMTRNQAITHAITLARENIIDGKSISESFGVSTLFPPLVLRMLRIGETTGNMAQALENVAYFYQREVQESISRLQALVEPVLTVILGLILAAIMFSVLGPVYEVLSKLKF